MHYIATSLVGSIVSVNHLNVRFGYIYLSIDELFQLSNRHVHYLSIISLKQGRIGGVWIIG